MTQITAPGAYTVTFTGRLSGKRFNDAKQLVKGKLNGQYDAATRAWTVTLDESEWDAVHGVSTLRTLAESYDATIEPASGTAIDRAALAAERRELVARLAEIDRLLEQQ